MATFTSTLPDELLKELKSRSKTLSIPMNKIIENATRIYLEHLNRAEYIRSYKEAGSDHDLISIAEEGMEDYLDQLKDN